MRANEWIPIPEVGDTLDNLLGHCRKQREKKGLQIDGKKIIWNSQRKRTNSLKKTEKLLENCRFSCFPCCRISITFFVAIEREQKKDQKEMHLNCFFLFCPFFLLWKLYYLGQKICFLFFTRSLSLLTFRDGWWMNSTTNS